MATVSQPYEPLVAETSWASGTSAWECLLAIRHEIAGEPLAVWETSDLSFAGIGAVRRIEASGPARFAEARNRLDAAFSGFEPRSAHDRVLAVGGFALESDGRRGWPGFPDLSFVVPERILLEANGGTQSIHWKGPAAPPSHAGTAPSPSSSESWDREAWIDAVRRTLARIEEGALLKAVLARSRTVPLGPGQSALSVYASLREAYPTCYRFLIEDGRGNAFLGASPERLVHGLRAGLATEAVAGTQRCGPGDDTEALADALLHSIKDRAEHELVVRHLIDALNPICSGLESIGPEVMRLPGLLHLRTRLTGGTQGAHVLDLISRLHPTPAVAGSPQGEALDWIAGIEGGSRGWYSGGIGWVGDSGCGDFAVGIRSIAIRGNQARVFAGAGIVEGSDPELEWNETELKMQGMLDAIARA